MTSARQGLYGFIPDTSYEFDEVRKFAISIVSQKLEGSKTSEVQKNGENMLVKMTQIFRLVSPVSDNSLFHNRNHGSVYSRFTFKHDPSII